jgi:hypothetical protein
MLLLLASVYTNRLLGYASKDHCFKDHCFKDQKVEEVESISNYIIRTTTENDGIATAWLHSASKLLRAQVENPSNCS